MSEPGAGTLQVHWGRAALAGWIGLIVLLALWLSRPEPTPRPPLTIVAAPDAGPVDAPPSPPDFGRDETRESAARRLGALDAFTLTRGERTLWAFVLFDELRTDETRFVVRVYERGAQREWRLRAEMSELSVRPAAVDGDPARLSTAMRMSGRDVPFFVVVTEDDVRFEPGEGYFMVPAR